MISIKFPGKKISSDLGFKIPVRTGYLSKLLMRGKKIFNSRCQPNSCDGGEEQLETKSQGQVRTVELTLRDWVQSEERKESRLSRMRDSGQQR